MAANQTFQLEEARGWRMGMRNLMRKESGEWLHTRRWWIQLLLWTVLINGLLFLVTVAVPQAAKMAGQTMTEGEIFSMGSQVLFGVASLGIGLGIVILSQDEIISEKTSGTAAWVLSKPASRVAFYLSKLTINGLSSLVLMIIIPFMFAFLQLLHINPELNLIGFLAAIGVLIIHTFFYLALSLLIGVFSEKRSLVLSVTLGVLLGGQVLMNFIKELMYFTPIGLANIMIAMISEGVLSIPALLWLPIGLTMIYGLLFVILSLRKIQKLEF